MELGSMIHICAGKKRLSCFKFPQNLEGKFKY